MVGGRSLADVDRGATLAQQSVDLSVGVTAGVETAARLPERGLVGIGWADPPADHGLVLAGQHFLVHLGDVRVLQGHVHADLSEILVDDDGHLVGHRPRVRFQRKSKLLATLLEEAVRPRRPSCVAQELLRLRWIVRIAGDLRRVVRLQDRRDRAVGEFGGAEEHLFDDGLAVNGIGDRLPHPEVGEDREPVVQIDHVVVHLAAEIDLDAGHGLQGR